MAPIPGLHAEQITPQHRTRQGSSHRLWLLQADLAAKYQLVFQSYARDLEAVQGQYEKHKAAPPLPRNAPPVAGNIQWARQLLRRIEAPMKRYALLCRHVLCCGDVWSYVLLPGHHSHAAVGTGELLDHVCMYFVRLACC